MAKTYNIDHIYQLGSYCSYFLNLYKGTFGCISNSMLVGMYEPNISDKLLPEKDQKIELMQEKTATYKF